MKILIVEDSKLMRSVVNRAIEISDISVEKIFEAENGREGIGVLKNNDVDLVLLDINMPVMNGEEMLEHIRGQDKTATLPVLIISTEGSIERRNRFRRLNAFFLRKPFTPEDLINRIEEIVKNVGE